MDFLLTQTIMQLSRQGIDVNKLLTRDLVENMRQRTRPDAIARLKRTLALGEVAKQEGITVEQEALEAKVQETMAGVEDPSAIDPDRLVQVVQEELLQEKILTWLAEVNTIELVPEGSLKPESSTEDEIEAADAVVDVAAETTSAAADEEE